jgi:L-ascorbate metabolism protein UlaG (beta-lactamase superfamily)
MAEIKWFGHNCFRIRAKEATVIIDPVDRVTGYVMPKQTADIVAISHDHNGHSNLNAIKPEYQIVDGPGEYEMHDVFITGIRTYHDAVNGAERGYNVCYLIELEGIVFCHLGDLGHPLSTELAELMGSADVLMIAAGGPGIIDFEQAAEIVGQLEPKVVIPMQFATANGDKQRGDIEAFCKALGVASPEAIDKLTIKPSDLAEAMQVIVLQPESDGVKK